MTDNRFFQDEEISALYWPDESCIKAGQNNVEKITIIMESF